MQQRTLKKEIGFTGIGVHTAKITNVKIFPAPVDTGIRFIRVDFTDKPFIIAHVNDVIDTYFATTICSRSNTNAKIYTVEHLLSALFSLGIDNAIIEIDNEEIPIMDGSANDFLFLLECSGVEEQDKIKRFIRIKEEITLQDNDSFATLSPYEGFCIDFQGNYNHPALEDKPQQYSFVFSKHRFAKEISRARTFGFMKDIQKLNAKGLALGGSLKNAIVMDDKKILNKEGLRFSSELVRHKIMDVVGDLSLLGAPIIGKFTGVRSGHRTNNLLARKLLAESHKWEWVIFGENEKVPLQFC